MERNLYDIDTGAYYTAKICRGSRNVGRQRKLIEIYMKKYYGQEKTDIPKVSFLTLGSDETFDNYLYFQEKIQKYIRKYLQGKEYLYCMELGEKGRRLHCHFLIPERRQARYDVEFGNEVYEILTKEGEKILEEWRNVSGYENPHIDSRIIRSKNKDTTKQTSIKTSKYIAKYLTKCKDIAGIRKFRSSKNLKYNLTKEGYTPEPAKEQIWIMENLNVESLIYGNDRLEKTA